MPSLVTIAQFLLSPLLVIASSCGVDGTSYSNRIVDNGHDVLYSKARAQHSVARFECKASDSGICHYTLYPEACTGDPGCRLAPLRRFSVAKGRSTEISGLRDFRVCVGTSDAALRADCEPVAGVAAR
jgi:hypothetical protein